MEINDELSDFNNDNVQYKRPIQWFSEGDIVRTTNTDRSQDFFQNNKLLERKCTTTRIKSRNFLSNTSYVGINNEYFYNENFIFDVYLLVMKKLNPFSLDRKLNDKNKHEMLYMLWKECMPQKFYQYICKEKNFLYLDKKNVLHPKVSEIITEFLKEDDENYVSLRNNLSQYKIIFQYVYSTVFPEIYCSTERRGFDFKSTFHIIFKTYEDKKRMEQLGKNSQNYKNIWNETFVYEQKPIKIDDFNEAEEKDVKERAEKRKRKRREVAEKNKLF